MKVAIIGAGNMGGAIARGLAQGTIIPASDVTVADPFSGSLETLQADYPEINVTTENPKAIKDADIVILAVKPWLIDQVLSVIHLTPQQVLVSIAGGVALQFICFKNYFLCSLAVAIYIGCHICIRKTHIYIWNLRL